MHWFAINGIAETVALASVALIGYLFGRRTSRVQRYLGNGLLRTELARAARMATEMRETSRVLLEELQRHRTSVSRFERLVRRYRNEPTEENWEVLGDEADALIGPTLRLATCATNTHNSMRRNSSQLATLADSRTDLHTGLHNRRAFDELLRAQMHVVHQMQSKLSLVLLNISGGPWGASAGEIRARQFAGLLDETRRETDLPAHFGVDEFAVLLPQTHLGGGVMFARRVLQRAAADTDLLVCGAVVDVVPGESFERLLSRATSALYSARTTGQPCIFLHNGVSIHECSTEEAIQQTCVGNVGFVNSSLSITEDPVPDTARDEEKERAATG